METKTGRNLIAALETDLPLLVEAGEHLKKLARHFGDQAQGIEESIGILKVRLAALKEQASPQLPREDNPWHYPASSAMPQPPPKDPTELEPMNYQGPSPEEWPLSASRKAELGMPLTKEEKEYVAAPLIQEEEESLRKGPFPSREIKGARENPPQEADAKKETKE